MFHHAENIAKLCDEALLWAMCLVSQETAEFNTNP